MDRISSPFSWKNREKDLSRVLRYHKFRIMFYRTNLLIHSLRVQAIVRELLPLASVDYPDLCAKKTLLISKYHDDPEMASKRGDVPLQLKLLMDADEALKLKSEELAAADFLRRSYRNPTIGGLHYHDLLMHAMHKDCVEAQLHSFADKLDGYGEALHEVLAGNTAFLEPVINYSFHTFNNPKGKFPLLEKCFRPGNGYFYFPVAGRNEYLEDGLVNAHPHTEASLATNSGIEHYEMWKRVTLSLPNGLEALTLQREFIGPKLEVVPSEDVSDQSTNAA
jgi:hypothetical protein